MSTAASQYLREVKKRIPCSGSQKAEFLCQLEAEVIYYCEDHDDVDFVALSECFGSPEEIASDFLSELGANSINRATLAKQRAQYAAILILVITIVLVSGIIIYTAYKQQQALDVHYIESITYEGDVAPHIDGSTYWIDQFESE